MARGGGTKYKKRETQPDSIYKNVLVSKFINRLMKDGKKTIAQRAVYGAFDLIKEQGLNPIEIFESAIDNVGPKHEVKAKRIGGAAYQVPQEVRGERRVSLSIRWLLEAANKRSNSENNNLSKKLAAELMDASNNSGEAIRKRDIAHKMAEANKAFAHFRW